MCLSALYNSPIHSKGRSNERGHRDQCPTNPLRAGVGAKEAATIKEKTQHKVKIART